MTIGSNIYRIRHEKGMSRREVAAIVGCSPSAVQKAEEEEGGVSTALLEAIARAIGTSLDDLDPTNIRMDIVLDPGAYKPERAHNTDAGYDLRIPKTDMVMAHGSLVVDTGVHIAIPKGYAGVICSKSGLNVKHGIISDGLVDSGYTGSVRVKLYNLSNSSYIFEAGDKISQIVFIPVASAGLVEVDSLEETARGDGGFGSTGR